MARSSFLTPGFRFHPTDVELVMYYLKRKLLGKKLIVEALAEVNIYDFSPWDLPDKSNLRSGDLEWFFFCPKARKYLIGSRSNRATETGFWKATGKDTPVVYKQRNVAMIKHLVFHRGHAPNGERTDWVMHEYRMDDKNLANAGVVQDTYVVCKIFKKSGAGPKNGAQYGAPFNEEEWGEPLTEPGSSLIDPGSCLTEPGPSTVTVSANQRHLDKPAIDEGVLTAEEIASIMNVNGDSNDKEEQMKNTDNAIYDDLANLINLDDLGETASNRFNEIDYTIAFLKADDLDDNLRDFYVD